MRAAPTVRKRRLAPYRRRSRIGPGPGSRSARGVGWWIAGAWLVLFFHLFFWQHANRIAPLAIPQTPVDRVSPDLRGQWTLLMNARPWIPAGADFTVRTENLDREMSLYMLSLAVFPRARSIPSSYFAMPLPAVGGRARYVIDENCRAAARPPSTTIGSFPGGCVRRR